MKMKMTGLDVINVVNTLYITICLEKVCNDILLYFFIEIGWKVPGVKHPTIIDKLIEENTKPSISEAFSPQFCELLSFFSSV